MSEKVIDLLDMSQYISNETGIDYQTIFDVLEAEFEYLNKLGLIKK